MIRISVKKDVQTQLAGVDNAELCDDSGKPLGRFLSESLYRRLLYDWANARISDEELQHRRQAPGGSQLSEIWAELKRT